MSVPRISARAIGLGRSALASRTSISVQWNHAVRWSSTGTATIADTGFWKSLIPKPLRKATRNGNKGKKSKEWNPATFFIVMFLFIGSMSIQMIALRNQSERYNRRSTVRISQLREALKKLQNGEDVDVNRLLGNVNDSQKDIDWEEMLKAIEQDEESQKAEEAESLKQTESVNTTTTLKTPILEIEADDKAADAEIQPTKPKSASFGNFF